MLINLYETKKIAAKEKKLEQEPLCSDKLGTLSNNQLLVVKQAITDSLRYIKGYTGPSRIWFAYQDSLFEGCNRLSAIISKLPVSNQTATLIVDLLLRLDKKLCSGGVDDSDGQVGGFIENVVNVLQKFVKLDPNCVTSFEKLKDQETCFGWEKPLLKK